jgi:phosphoribosylcarboxyaminoimidazole (NCAIR) mutase
MAIEKNIKINVDTKGAVNEVDKLDDSFKRLDKETEKTSKGLKDVGDNGGAIAILDGLTGGLATRMRDAFEATKLFNISLKGTRTALIATGVGLFIVALGVVVAYWEQIEEAILGANRKLQEQVDLSIKVQESIGLQLSLTEKQLTLANKQGKAAEALQEQRLAILNILREENTTEIKLLEIQAAKLKSAAFELTTREKILKAVLNTAKAGSGDAFILSKQVEAANQYKDLLDAITKAKEKQVDLDIKIFDINNPEGEIQRQAEPLFTLENGLTFEDNLTLGSRELLNEKLLGLDEELRNNIEMRATMAENERIADDARERERKQLLADAIIQIAGQTAGLVGAIAKEGTALAKGAAIAQATISGFQGVQSAFTTAAASPVTTFFPAYPFIQAGLAGAFSAIQIAKIGKVSSNGGGQSPNGQTGGGGGRTPQAPAFNLVQGSASNQIANSLQRGNEPLKAYVTSTDMTSAQQLDRAIESGSTL